MKLNKMIKQIKRAVTPAKPKKAAKAPKKAPKKVKQVKKTPAPKRATKPVPKLKITPIKIKPAKKPMKMAKPKMPKPKVAKMPAKAVPKSAKKVQQLVALVPHPVVEVKQVRQYPVLPGGQNARITMILPILRELVKREAISDWLINIHHDRKANLYVERNFTVEDELSAIREDVLVTVYQRFPDNTIGEAQIPIITADPAIARKQIMDAKETCTYARKLAFDLAQPSDDITMPQCHDEKMLAASFAGNGLQIPYAIYNQIKSAMSPVQDVKVNSFEVLTSAGTIRVINSNGVDVSYHKTNTYIEIVMTAKEKDEEREFLYFTTAVSPEQLDLQSILTHQTQIVRDATTAQPNPGFTGDVLLSGQSVTEVFAPHHDLNPIVLHTFAKLHVLGLSTFKQNQPLGHFIGDPITISSNPTLPLGLYTAPVDEEGTPLKQVEMIRGGIFANHIAGARYAQYLSVPTTGNISNVQMSPGAIREQHLRGNNYFEIVSFSWFNPNSLSGDFSAEIRLGYKWTNGKRTPFRGGTFTGNMFKNILNVRLSKETMQSGGYYGPRAILFKEGVINKFE